jgi:hypothetical protein
MADVDLVTYCGLYCALCAERARVPKQAAVLRETMAKEGWDFWGKEVPGFEGFWGFLGRLCELDNACPGCRRDGGPPFCTIRKCARERGAEVCAICEEHPCDRVRQIAKGYPMLLHDAARIREAGLDAWIAEQEKRAAAGFCYADIRCRPYTVPDK